MSHVLTEAPKHCPVLLLQSVSQVCSKAQKWGVHGLYRLHSSGEVPNEWPRTGPRQRGSSALPGRTTWAVYEDVLSHGLMVSYDLESDVPQASSVQVFL